jgi:hypothetical protein
VYLEAIIVIAVAAALLAQASALARPLAEARGPAAMLRGRIFEARLRRTCARVKLPFWVRGAELAVSRETSELAVPFFDGRPEGILRVAVIEAGKGYRLELRTDGVLRGSYAGLEAAAIEPWTGPHGALFGIRLDIVDPTGARREIRVGFGTPGGTL